MVEDSTDQVDLLLTVDQPTIMPVVAAADTMDQEVLRPTIVEVILVRAVVVAAAKAQLLVYSMQRPPLPDRVGQALVAGRWEDSLVWLVTLINRRSMPPQVVQYMHR